MDCNKELTDYLNSVRKEIYTVTGVTLEDLELNRVIVGIANCNLNYKKAMEDRYSKEHNKIVDAIINGDSNA